MQKRKKMTNRKKRKNAKKRFKKILEKNSRIF